MKYIPESNASTKVSISRNSAVVMLERGIELYKRNNHHNALILVGIAQKTFEHRGELSESLASGVWYDTIEKDYGDYRKRTKLV